MYIFFMIFGLLFISISATFINYIYDIFSINKLTNFLSPIDNKSIWNKINITILPILIWSIIEIPVVGDNGNFIFSVIVNIIISSAIIYEIKYSAMVFFNKENNTINLISIYAATILGQTVQFMILKMKPFFYGSYITTIISILLLLAFYIFITMKPPKTVFFRGYEKKD